MEAKIALIGDSNMWRLWQLWVDTYPQRITGVRIRFFGNPGANLNGSTFQDRYIDIIAFAPHFVFIWIGVNDHTQFVRNAPFYYDW